MRLLTSSIAARPHVALLDTVDQRLRIELVEARWDGEQTRGLRLHSKMLQCDSRAVGDAYLDREGELRIDPAAALCPVRRNHVIFEGGMPADGCGVDARAVPVAPGPGHIGILRGRLPCTAGMIRIDRNEDLREGCRPLRVHEYPLRGPEK